MAGGRGTLAFDVPNELPLSRRGWRTAISLLAPLWAAAALLVYGLVLGGSGLWLWALIAILVAMFGWPITVALASLVPQLTGPSPALTAAGVRLRRRPWHRRLVTIPWPEIRLLWIGYRGQHGYLCVEGDPRGATADEWDPNGRRFSRSSPPLVLPLPRSAPPDQVRDAVTALSGGTVSVADRGPDLDTGPDDDAWANRPRDRRLALADERRRAPAALVAVVLVGAVVGVPFLLRVAPPWNQAWWPGTRVAASIPDACGVFTDEQRRNLGVTGARYSADGPRHSECEYTVPQGDLLVSVRRFDALFGSSAAKAESHFDELSAAMAGGPRRIGGIGDEAWFVANPSGSTTLFDRGVARIVARRANVVLVIAYGGEQEPEVATDAVVSAARTILAGLDIH